jgi:hypothetical protein
VDALRADKKRYYYVDGLVREWVRLHARGRPAMANELREAARAALAAAATPEAAAALSAEPEAEPATARRDHLMEID